MLKCGFKNCQRKYPTPQAVGIHRRYVHGIKGPNSHWKAAKPSTNGNGHIDIETMRNHGLKYLESRRETLLSAIDEIDSAMKALKL